MDIIEEAEKAEIEFSSKNKGKIENLVNLSKKVAESASKIESSWSGSFAGWHGRMYYRNFEIPPIGQKFSGEWGDLGFNGMPDGWEEKQPEEVQAKIEELIGGGFSLDDFEGDVKYLRKEADNLKREISIIFLPINYSKETEKEKDILLQIENFEFGKTKQDYIKTELPTNIMTRDLEALRQGICVSSWLYYGAVAFDAKNIYESLNGFLQLINRLIRQLRMKKTGIAEEDQVSDNVLLMNLRGDIYKKCQGLYDKKEYAEAVEKGFKVVRDRLRNLTGHETGSEAFGKGKLHIKGAAASNVDQDFNEGVKLLTMAIDRFRNEKAHTSDAKIADPIRAYEYLRLSSLAMNLLDNSEIVP